MIKEYLERQFANYHAITSGYVTPEMFGAKGDGVTDDTEALKKAVTHSKLVLIPKKTYVISSRIDIPSNTTISGEGKESVIIASGGFPSATEMFRVNTKSNISVSNLTISGNSAVNVRGESYNDINGIHPFDIIKGTNITIKNCIFKDNIYAAVRTMQNCSDISITDTQFADVDCGFIALGSGNLANLTIERCVFRGHEYSEPISLFGTGTYSHIRINNCTFSDKINGHAILSASGTTEDIIISNNTINNCAVGIRLQNASKVVIADNKIIATTSGKGINVMSSTDVAIKDNYVANTSEQGMYINACTNSVISGNTIVNCGTKNKDFVGTDIRGICDVIMTANTMIKTNNSLSNNIFVAHSTGSLLIKNNSFIGGVVWLASDSANVTLLDNSSASIKDSGTDNVYTNENLDKPTVSEQDSIKNDSTIVTALQTEIADTNSDYVMKLKDVVTGNNYYLAVSNGRLIAVTESEINSMINPN